MTILLIILLVLFSLIIWYRTTWAVILIPLILPAYLWRFDLGWVPFTFLEATILILVVVWLIKVFIYQRKVLLGDFKWILGFIVIISGISVLVSSDKTSALGVFKAYFVEPMLYFVVFVNVIREEKYFKWLLYIFGISVIFISLISTFQYLGFVESLEPWISQTPKRVSSLFEYPNAVGLFLAPLITLFIGFLLLPIGKKFYLNKFFLSLIIILGILALYFSNVRGAILGVVLGTLFISIFSPKRQWWWLGFLVVIILLLIIPQTQDKIFNLVKGQDVSQDVRTVLWHGSWNLLKERPFWGAGLASFPVVYDQYRLIKHTELLLYPHNIFLNFWVELGISGLIIFLWLIIKFFIQGSQALKENLKSRVLSASLMGSMVTLIGYGLVDVPYFKNDLAILFWLIIGLMVVLLNLSSKFLDSKE